MQGDIPDPDERVLGEQMNVRAVILDARLGHVIAVNRLAPSRVTDIETEHSKIAYHTRDGWVITIDEGKPKVSNGNETSTVQWVRILNPEDAIRSDTVADDVVNLDVE